jgi:hypothetical protein
MASIALYRDFSHCALSHMKEIRKSNTLFNNVDHISLK